MGISAALVVLTLLTFAPVRHHEFLQFDDADYVMENLAVQAGLTLPGLQWAFTSFYAGNWHPLTWLSHMTDVQLFGLDPGWHHLSSLLIHLLATLVLFRMLSRLTGAFWPSAAVAALFAAHPLHVESVAWVAERKDVLSGLWWVITIGAYGAYTRTPTVGRYGAVAVAFALALMSKPMAVTLPFLLLLVDIWPLDRWRGVARARVLPHAASLVKEKLPLFAMAAAAAVLTLLAQRQAGAVQSLDELPLALRLAKVPVTYVQYILMTLWPSGLSPLYAYPQSVPGWQWIGSTALLAAVTAGVVRVIRSQPYLFVGWCWFLGTLVPVIGLVQAGAQPYADRFMYVPAIGLFIMAAWSARQMAMAHPGWLQPLSAAGLILVLGASVAAYRQTRVWNNSVTLWEQAVRVEPRSYRAQTNLGFALAEAGLRNRAMSAYLEAIRLQPAYANAHNYLGVLLSELGDLDRAAASIEQAIALRPRFAEAHNNLGLTRAAQDRLPEAILAFAEALRLAPTFSAARNNLGIAYARTGQHDRAIAAFEETVRQQPGSAESRMNLASALAASFRQPEALAHFEAAASLGGDPVRVHHAWGRVLMELGDMPAAIGHLTTALRANPRFAPAVHDLGRALALSGRLDESLDALRSAILLDPDNPDYHHDFGAALARRGLIADAIAEMETALRLDPGHVEAREALRTLRK